MPVHPSSNSSWKELLAFPPSAAHVVQIYDSQDFLASAVGHYAAEGLQHGEAVLLFGTPAHLDGVRAELGRMGVDAAAASRRGQLVLNDVHAALAAMCPGGALDGDLYDAIAGGALERVRAEPRFRGLRLWGETCNTLYHAGRREEALLTEARGEALARKHGAALFCSFLCDKYDACGYGCLEDMCATHTHVIPADDYVRHRLAVNRAIAEVVGDIRGSLLQSLASWKGFACDLPSSQAMLFWLRETMPEHFEAVLARARDHHARHARRARPASSQAS